jgi:hypothetical protein
MAARSLKTWATRQLKSCAFPLNRVGCFMKTKDQMDGTVRWTGRKQYFVNGGGAVAICVGMIPALSSGINLSDHAARSMI